MNLYGYDWPQGGTKQVIYIDRQQHLKELVVALSSPWQVADLAALTGAPLASGSALTGYAWSAGGTKQAAYIDEQGHVIELFVSAGAPWKWVDLTALTGAPLAGQDALAGYDWLNGGTKQVVYVDEQGHVIELFVAPGRPWQWADLTELTGAPLPSGSALTGYAWSTGSTEQVVYVDEQGHVIELFVAPGRPWQWAELTELTGAPLPSGSALTGYAWSAGATKQVTYVDKRGHVIELFVAAGASWQSADLTELTGAPLAGQDALAGYDWLNGGTKQVVYADEQGHVIELFVAAGSLWQWADLTKLTSAPLFQQFPLTGYGWVWGATKQVAYVDEQGHVIELHAGLNSHWRCANLTALTKSEPIRGIAARV
jgi:catechol 2,3-dioxygenase-like lactoylglutathione lyase family enzyme